MYTTKILCFIVLVSSTAALLTSPPKIVKQPTQEEILFQVAQPGEIDKPFIIECKAEGEPAPKYKWTINGKPFDYTSYGNRIFQQSGRGTLVVSQPRDEDHGQYQCFAYNEWGTAASNSVFVRRAEVINIIETDDQVIWVDEGKSLKLTCERPKGHPQPNLFWMLQSDQGQLKIINNSRITPDNQGNLWFSHVTLEDGSAGAYICTSTSIFTSEYTLRKRIHLNVKADLDTAPAIEHSTNEMQKPVRLYASESTRDALLGEKVELYCIYGGRPLPQIVWKKNRRLIHKSKRIAQFNFGKTLVIWFMTHEDPGTYTCEVSNGVGPAQSHSILLHIKAAPFFKMEPEIQNIREGETAEIKCKFGGIPAPKITWIHNGKPIEQAEPNPRRQVNPNSIVITNLVRKDTGNYGCNATNAYGYVYKDVYINCLPSDKTSSDSNSKLGIIMIITSSFGAALIMLFVIACYLLIRKRCWVRNNPFQIPQLPANDLSNRFYVNMLFRKECDAEIEEIENHRYEEVSHPYQETDLRHEELPGVYEEINP